MFNCTVRGFGNRLHFSIPVKLKPGERVVLKQAVWNEDGYDIKLVADITKIPPPSQTMESVLEPKPVQKSEPCAFHSIYD